MEERIHESKASEMLINFIKDCDGDTLAAIFEYAFADVQSARYEADEIIYERDTEMPNSQELHQCP